MSDGWAEHSARQEQRLQDNDMEAVWQSRRDAQNNPPRSGSSEPTLFDHVFFWLLKQAFLIALLLLPAYVLLVQQQAYLSTLRAVLETVYPAALIHPEVGPTPPDARTTYVVTIAVTGALLWLLATLALRRLDGRYGPLVLLAVLSLAALRVLVIVQALALIGGGPTLLDVSYPDLDPMSLPFRGWWPWTVGSVCVALLTLRAFVRADDRAEKQAAREPAAAAPGPVKGTLPR